MSYWAIGEVLERGKGGDSNLQSQDPRGVGDGKGRDVAQVPPLPLTDHVTLGKSDHFTELYFLYL